MYSFVAFLGHLAIDHASLSRRLIPRKEWAHWCVGRPSFFSVRCVGVKTVLSVSSGTDELWLTHSKRVQTNVAAFNDGLMWNLLEEMTQDSPCPLSQHNSHVSPASLHTVCSAVVED